MKPIPPHSGPMHAVNRQCENLANTDNYREVLTLVAQLVKNPPAMQETLVQFLGQEDPLEKGQAAHASILAWRIPWTV